MKDPAHRVQRWRAKYKADRLKATIDDLYDHMAERYQAAVVDLWAIEAKVRETLNACGVSTSLYVPYLNFGRQLYKLSRQQRVSGPSFALAAHVLLIKWRARGLDRRVLARIRTEVFDVGEPTVEDLDLGEDEPGANGPA